MINDRTFDEKTGKKFVWHNAFIFLILFSGTVYAQSPFSVSGIMSGPEPMAIINGEVVQKGDKIDGAVILEISDEHVKIEYNGRVLTEPVKATNKPQNKKTTATPPPPSEQQERYFENKARSQTKLNLKKVDEYANQAAWQERRSLPSVANYKKVLDLLKKAENEAQYALERHMNNPTYREKIKSTIAEIRLDMEGVKNRKKALEQKIREAIRDDRLVGGMTKRDVRQVLGRPTKVNKGDSSYYAEEWYYEKEYPNERDRHYYFTSDGILTSSY